MNYSKDDFKALFQAKFDYNKWFAMLKDFFKADELRNTAEPISDPADCDKGYYIGAINTSDSYRIGLFYYEIGHSNVARKKVGLRNLVRTFINPNWGQFDAALAVFSDGEHWRLSLISDIKGEATAAKRYTFVFGEHDNLYRTAIERFSLIRSEGPSFEVLKKAFSVEALTEEFFGLYKDHYERFCDFIYQNADDRRYFGPEFAQWNNNKDSQKFIRDYVKNLMGRIVFLQFLQKKGWMGVPTDRNDWVGGDPYFMQHLYDYATEEQKDDFLDEVLEPLFFNCLNVLRPGDVFDTNVKGIGIVKVPYLNGELFEQKEVDKAQSRFPKKYFHDLLNLFLQYNFTIDENDPNDAEIGVDPEMLGKIFENLLEDNKDKGAFYTPKEIVRYMCKESLISYLCSNNGVKHADSIKVLVNNHQLTPKLQEDVKTCERLNKHLRNVKVCDPAIGSGAFPMGLMNEIFACRSVLHENIGETDEEMSGQIKREIIQNNIYGVDIEQGAVDIARLRFWLALVVDSVKPEPLPNLDYKIMQGNSLVESYKGLDLSNLLHNDNLFVATKSEELGKYMKNYFRATDNEEKRKLRNQIDFTIKQCINLSGIQETVELPNTNFFLWHTYFHDVFKEGGFDIVIGNPPYIKEYTNRKAFDGFREQSPYYQGKMDIWYGFACNGLDMLQKNGVLCFIAPNNWTTNSGASKMRLKVTKEAKIQQMVDFNDYMIFGGSASIQTMIMLFTNTLVNDEYKFDYRKVNKGQISISDICKVFNKTSDKAIYLNPVVSPQNGEGLLTFSDDITSKLLYDISNNADFLTTKELAQGIVFPQDFLNKKGVKKLGRYWVGKGIFGLSTEELNELNLSETELKLIKPYFTSNEIELYYTNPSNHLWMIYTDSTFKAQSSLDFYPNIKHHLDNYIDIFTSDNKPYGLHRARNPFFFTGKKILVQRKCVGRPLFSYADFDTYVTQTYYCIKTSRFSLKYLLGVFNSKLISFWLKHKGKMQGENFQIDKEPLLQIPIKVGLKEDVIAKVDRILSAKRLDPSADTTADEQEIDRLVYHLYGLTYDEVKIVDPETPITEEEYDA